MQALSRPLDELMHTWMSIKSDVVINWKMKTAGTRVSCRTLLEIFRKLRAAVDRRRWSNSAETIPLKLSSFLLSKTIFLICFNGIRDSFHDIAHTKQRPSIHPFSSPRTHIVNIQQHFPLFLRLPLCFDFFLHTHVGCEPRSWIYMVMWCIGRWE